MNPRSANGDGRLNPRRAGFQILGGGGIAAGRPMARKSANASAFFVARQRRLTSESKLVLSGLLLSYVTGCRVADL
jgi:hypothetical protein